jgi:hypothetical protein
MKALSCTVVLFCASIAGCVTTGTQQIANYAEQLDKARTLSGFRDVPVRPLPINETLFQSIGLQSGEDQPRVAIDLEGERTFVSMFRLPEWTQSYSISVASMMFGGAADPAIFYPRYIFLGEDYTQLRRSKATDFVFRTGATEGMVSATVYVNDGNRDERYLAVVAEPRKLVTEQVALTQSAGAVPLVVPVGGGALVWMVPTGGNEGPRKMRAAASGVVRIKTESYKPKRLGEETSQQRFQ